MEKREIQMGDGVTIEICSSVSLDGQPFVEMAIHGPRTAADVSMEPHVAELLGRHLSAFAMLAQRARDQNAANLQVTDERRVEDDLIRELVQRMRSADQLTEPTAPAAGTPCDHAETKPGKNIPRRYGMRRPDR